MVTHKQFLLPEEKIYTPLVAGAREYRNSTFPEEYLRDDNGDNISILHNLYSEYTAAYWISKNSNADIIGINHYRRFFVNTNWFTYYFCLLSPQKNRNRFIIKEQDIKSLFGSGIDCILPKKYVRTKNTLYQQYDELYGSDILDSVRDILISDYPDMVEIFDNLMQSYEFYGKCLMILKKPMYDKYIEWCFDICNKLENKGYGNKEREFAFLLERIMNVWFEYMKRNNLINVKEMFWINTEFPLSKVGDRMSEYVFPRWMLTGIRKIRNISK